MVVGLVWLACASPPVVGVELANGRLFVDGSELGPAAEVCPAGELTCRRLVTALDARPVAAKQGALPVRVPDDGTYAALMGVLYAGGLAGYGRFEIAIGASPPFTFTPPEVGPEAGRLQPSPSATLQLASSAAGVEGRAFVAKTPIGPATGGCVGPLVASGGAAAWHDRIGVVVHEFGARVSGPWLLVGDDDVRLDDLRAVEQAFEDAAVPSPWLAIAGEAADPPAPGCPDAVRSVAELPPAEPPGAPRSSEALLKLLGAHD